MRKLLSVTFETTDMIITWRSTGDVTYDDGKHAIQQQTNLDIAEFQQFIATGLLIDSGRKPHKPTQGLLGRALRFIRETGAEGLSSHQLAERLRARRSIVDEITASLVVQGQIESVDRRSRYNRLITVWRLTDPQSTIE